MEVILEQELSYLELAKAKIKIQIDIGYDDAVTPGPIDAHYPVFIQFIR